jgi:hypothetical protein
MAEAGENATPTSMAAVASVIRNRHEPGGGVARHSRHSVFRRCMERESREALFQAPANLRSMACAKLASAAGRGDETVNALHNG